MIKLLDAIEIILNKDQEASSCLSRGLLNFSSYAREIHEEVEFLTKKEVKVQSIIVTLSRFSKTFSHKPLDIPITIENVSVHTNLQELTYEKTTENLDLIQKVYKKIPKGTPDYFTTTQSSTEITIVGEKNIINFFKKSFLKIKPKSNYENLAGITVKFPIKYIDNPNIIFSLIKKLAIKHINLIEVVSSLTELTFIVHKSDLSLVLSQLTGN